MASVFDKFGGIRPMASKLGEPPSTVKSWHTKRHIPRWRHAQILAAAEEHGLKVSAAELENIPADRSNRSRAKQSTGLSGQAA
jgi:hypothetical protein